MTDEIVPNAVISEKTEMLVIDEATDNFQNNKADSLSFNTEPNENSKQVENLNTESNGKVSNCVRIECEKGHSPEVCLRTELDTTDFDTKNTVNNCNSVLTLKFSNINNMTLLKEDTIGFFRSFVDLDVELDEVNMLINVYKDDDFDRNEWVVVNRNDIDSSTFEDVLTRKTKLSQEELEKRTKLEDLFVVDTSPSLSTKNCLQYESKFSVVNNDDVTTDCNRGEFKSANISLCFNCDENHNMRDCPKPKNQAKINVARQKFKSQQTKTTRYHLEHEQMYAHLRPGKLSNNLKSALGLDDNRLPDHVYSMRRLGYPPGWYKELTPSRSELVLFDFDGKRDCNKKAEFKVDPDMIIEYPGFNAPFEKHIKDEYKLHRCPSYSQEFNKCDMIKRIQCYWQSGDDFDTCDMDIDEAEPGQSSNKHQDSVEPQGPSTSPTLFLLESQKKKILEELSEDSGNDVKDDSAANLSLNEENNVTRFIMTSCYGTPIIKSTSPYCNLPSSEKFSKNVSEVINFENLPNSTGNYEHLTDVLKEVRRSMKDINKGNS